jgi:hypothetical protein
MRHAEVECVCCARGMGLWKRRPALACYGMGMSKYLEGY